MSLEYGDMLKDKYVRQRFELYKNMLLPYIKDRTKTLDIGCYTGDLLTFVPFENYYGVDSDSDALRVAHKRGAKVFHNEFDVDKIPIEEKFDIIIVAEVLEHLKHPEKLLTQVKELSTGVILISLPNENTVYHRLKVLFGKGIGLPFSDHYHLHFPTIRQSKEFIKKHFEIIEQEYYIHLGSGIPERILSLFPFGWLAKLLPSLFARGVVFLCKEKGGNNE